VMPPAAPAAAGIFTYSSAAGGKEIGTQFLSGFMPVAAIISGARTRRSTIFRRRPACDRAPGDRQHELAAAENQQRDRERHDVIEQPEQQEAGEQLRPVEAPERDQHGGIEDAEAAWGMACKPEQRRGDEDHRNRDETDVRLA